MRVEQHFRNITHPGDQLNFFATEIQWPQLQCCPNYSDSAVVDQFSKHLVLCCPLIAFDVIAKDHNPLASRAVQVMKGLITWPQATIDNQRSFPMPDIWFRVSALAQSRFCFRGSGLEVTVGKTETPINLHRLRYS
jgi:hypothetical protein